MTLLIRYGVRMGTSLDGPRAVYDLNRGNGYCERTTAGIYKAKQVCKRAAITRQTLLFARDVLDFLLEESYSVAPTGFHDSPYALFPDEYAELMIELCFLTFDHFVRRIALYDSRIYTFCDYFEVFLAIVHSGDVTACQRFVTIAEHSLGNIFNRPMLAELFQSPAALRQVKHRERIEALYGGCKTGSRSVL